MADKVRAWASQLLGELDGLPGDDRAAYLDRVVRGERDTAVAVERERTRRTLEQARRTSAWLQETTEISEPADQDEAVDLRDAITEMDAAAIREGKS